MQAYFRAFGRPLGALFLVLTVVWIVGMIVVPQITMVTRAFLWADRGSALTDAGVAANRLTRDIATVDYDLRAAQRQLATAAAAAGAGAAPAPAPTAGTPAALVPGIAVPSASRPAPPVPSVTTRSAAPALPVPGVSVPSATPALPVPGAAPGVPRVTVPSTAPSASSAGPVDLPERIAALEGQKRALEARLAEARDTETELAAGGAYGERWSLNNFLTMSDVHLQIFVSTIFYATLVTLIAFLVCYPVAYAVATTANANRAALLLLALVIPYAINELLRIFAWVMILEREGVLNSFLVALGVFAEGEGPRWVASNWAVFTVMVYAYVLFMVFPLYNTLETLDKNQIDAARDLGASTFTLHTRVVLPHAKPGIAVGAIMVFMLSAGTIAAPEIVGRGLHPDWFSQVIYRRFFESANWNQGSAYSLMLLLVCIGFIMLVMSAFRVSIRDIAK